jgi:hypothetical protein
MQPSQLADTRRHLEVSGLAGFIVVVVFGLIVGLGAPWWADLAKQLGNIHNQYGSVLSEPLRQENKENLDSPQTSVILVWFFRIIGVLAILVAIVDLVYLG